MWCILEKYPSVNLSFASWSQLCLPCRCLPLERATAIATATATATATAGEGEGEGRKGNDSKTPPSPLSNPSVLDLAEGVARHCEQLFHAAHQQDAPDSSLLAPSAVSAETLRGRWQGHFHYHLAVVLLRRDFVKEVRRARYWVMHFSRCVALGLFLGRYRWGEEDEEGDDDAVPMGWL